MNIYGTTLILLNRDGLSEFSSLSQFMVSSPGSVSSSSAMTMFMSTSMRSETVMRHLSSTIFCVCAMSIWEVRVILCQKSEESPSRVTGPQDLCAVDNLTTLASSDSANREHSSSVSSRVWWPSLSSFSRSPTSIMMVTGHLLMATSTPWSSTTSVSLWLCMLCSYSTLPPRISSDRMSQFSSSVPSSQSSSSLTGKDFCWLSWRKLELFSQLCLMMDLPKQSKIL